MKTHRRTFLESLGGGLAAAASAQGTRASAAPERSPEVAVEEAAPLIDFRYAPLSWQTAYCLPDDPFKSLVGERGELRYGHPGRPREGRVSNLYFPIVIDFSLQGMEADQVVGQRLEAPEIPIVHTIINRPRAILEMTAFATNRPEEGRVDNVLLEVRPVSERRIFAAPRVNVSARSALTVDDARGTVRIASDERLLLVADRPLASHADTGRGQTLVVGEGMAADDQPLRVFLRFPQQGQDVARLQAGLRTPERLLAEARDLWRAWLPTAGPVSWSMPAPFQNFLVACARNIAQAREAKDGRALFQVGPTVYRGLWVTDGNYLLEAARYLGQDREAQQGLETIWAMQEADGGIYAGAGRTHWKDNGIAMFMLVRQAELSQDWTYFRKMQPNVLRVTAFLNRLREQARNENNGNGRYGLLPQGFPDGGWWGPRAEFANTIGVLPGLKAVAEAAARQGISGFEPVQRLYADLNAALVGAARQEMRHHNDGFDYLPALMREDPAWADADLRERPKPQSAQWALANAIYPGRAFESADPIVRGYISLMQACTREDAPVETGFLHNEGLWTYDAAFAAHVYLWAGLTDWARRTFYGFLNHASPLYCWREEQPQRGALTAEYYGDMPHNQASAWCILYLRHMLALEDGDALRLLAGIGEPELRGGERYQLAGSPTRFGRLTLSLEPQGRNAWALRYQRAAGPAPERVALPGGLGVQCRFASVTGAHHKQDKGAILVDPEVSTWTATWKA